MTLEQLENRIAVLEAENALLKALFDQIWQARRMEEKAIARLMGFGEYRDTLEQSRKETDV